MMEFFKRGSRPAMMWMGLVLVPLALHPDVTPEKFKALLLFLAFLFVFRGFIDKGALERIVAIWKGRPVQGEGAP